MSDWAAIGVVLFMGLTLASALLGLIVCGARRPTFRSAVAGLSLGLLAPAVTLLLSYDIGVEAVPVRQAVIFAVGFALVLGVARPVRARLLWLGLIVVLGVLSCVQYERALSSRRYTSAPKLFMDIATQRHRAGVGPELRVVGCWHSAITGLYRVKPASSSGDAESSSGTTKTQEHADIVG